MRDYPVKSFAIGTTVKALDERLPEFIRKNGPTRYRRVERSECGLRCFRGFGAYVILVSRETNIGTQSEISEMWPLEVSRISHSFSALSESRLWGSNLRVDAYMHYSSSIFPIKNLIKPINSQKYYSIFSYSMFTFTDFSVFLSLRYRADLPLIS